MRYLITCFFLIIAINTVNAQSCDCTVPPPYSKKCADTCIALILNKASAEMLSSYLNISESIANKIVKGRSSYTYNTLRDVQDVLTKKEFKEVMKGSEKLYE